MSRYIDSGWIRASLALCLVVGVVAFGVTPALGQTSTFTDVDPDAYYAQDVAWLVDRGITTGIGPGLFGPNMAVTRGQAVTFLFRYSSSPAGSPGHGFTDVHSSDYYDEAVKWAFLFGITSGTATNLFTPGDLLTRGQMATLLYRCAGIPTGSPDPGFSDVSPSSFYASAVAWAKAVGVTTGTSTTTFSPDQTVTRGQIASFLRRLSDALGGVPCSGTPPNPAIQPTVTGTAASGTAQIAIVNAAPETLRFSMGGPTPTLEILDPCPTCQRYIAVAPSDACTRTGVVERTMTVDPGRYRVAFEAVSGSATPLFAEWLLGDGTAYSFCVVIIQS